MATQHLIFANAGLATAFVTRVDAALGLPRCECPLHANSPRRPGNHPACPCPGASVSASCKFATLTYATPRKHPTDNRHTVPIKPWMLGLLTGPETTALVSSLTSDWAPPLITAPPTSGGRP